MYFKLSASSKHKLSTEVSIDKIFNICRPHSFGKASIYIIVFSSVYQNEVYFDVKCDSACNNCDYMHCLFLNLKCNLSMWRFLETAFLVLWKFNNLRAKHCIVVCVEAAIHIDTDCWYNLFDLNVSFRAKFKFTINTK